MHQSKDGAVNQRKDSTTRKQISEALLAELFCLDKEWLDPANVIYLPEALPLELPQNGGRKISTSDVRDLKRYLDDLVARGCHRQVLYWCMEQLGPDADRK